MIDCKEYCFFFLMKDDVQVLHGDNFGGQLAFYKVFFEKDCYGFCKSAKTFNSIFKNLK